MIIIFHQLKPRPFQCSSSGNQYLHVNKNTNFGQVLAEHSKWILDTPPRIQVKTTDQFQMCVCDKFHLASAMERFQTHFLCPDTRTNPLVFSCLPSLRVTNLSEIKRFLMEQTVQMTLFPEEGIFMNIYLISFTFLRFYFKLCSPYNLRS